MEWFEIASMLDIGGAILGVVAGVCEEESVSMLRVYMGNDCGLSGGCCILNGWFEGLVDLLNIENMNARVFPDSGDCVLLLYLN